MNTTFNSKIRSRHSELSIRIPRCSSTTKRDGTSLVTATSRMNTPKTHSPPTNTRKNAEHEISPKITTVSSLPGSTVLSTHSHRTNNRPLSNTGNPLSSTKTRDSTNTPPASQHPRLKTSPRSL